MAVDLSTSGTPKAPLALPGARARSRRRARTMRTLAALLMLAGGVALLDAGITLVWQEPISALYTKLRQDHLSSALRAEERALPTPFEQRKLASLGDQRRRIAFLARELQRHAGDGTPVGRITIPRIGASFVVVKGTDTQALQGGPGIYPETDFPGMSGTTAIAGHRTTYLAPFRHIDALGPGSHIILRMPYALFTYTVIGQRVVEPTDVKAATARLHYNRLVLSACTPLFSAAKRLLVYAHLTRTVPLGAARKLPGGALARPIEVTRSGQALAHARRELPAVLKPLDPRLFAPLV